MKRKSVLLFLLLVVFSSSLAIAAVEPKHEYEKPGYDPGHAYDGILPEESIDLFTGALNLSHRDVRVPNFEAFQNFSPLITRTYSSKIYRQESISGSCNPYADTVDDEFVGLGWSLHFGRLWDYNGINPVLELPDGSHHMFYTDTNRPTSHPEQMITKSMWILRRETNSSGTQFYEATSPGPDMVKLQFFTTTNDTRDGRLLLHAEYWSLYRSGTSSPVTTRIIYAKDSSGHSWPRELREACNTTSEQSIFFNWTTSGTLTSITVPWIGGTNVTYSYNVVTQNGRKLLRSFSTPLGRTYQYDYDPATFELTKMTVSTDASIGAGDVVIEYTYASKNFYMNPLFISSACARVVTQKQLTNTNSSLNTWTYAYPAATATVHKVEVTNPEGDKREVTFQGYANIGSTVWKVGSILKDETFNACCSSLISIDNIYDFKQISNTPDPQANLLDTMKIPVLLQTTKTYSQTGQQAVTSFGTSANYDRFGNADFMIEKHFSGSQLRRTEYQYEHRDGDSNDSIMTEAHVVRAISNVKVLNGSGTRVSESTYTYNSTPTTYNTFGLVATASTWNSETGLFLDKRYSYDSYRQVSQIVDENGTTDRTTNLARSCNLVTNVTDNVTSAGPIFEGTVDKEPHLYTSTQSPNDETTSYSWDRDQRLTLISPPSGSSISISYSDSNRQVTLTQGASSTVETFDGRGRMIERRTEVASGQFSYQKFSYDSLDNVINQTEKSFSSSSTVSTSTTYDGLNRIRSVDTPDGLTEYIYNGPDVTVRVHSEFGTTLDTRMTYDAGGRLTSVVDPNNFTTTYGYDALDRLTSVAQTGLSTRTLSYSSRGNLLSETHPESGTTTYTYDTLGRLSTRKFAGAATPIQYTYDLRDRIETINYPNDADVTFYYDGDAVPGRTVTYINPKSHLTGMVDGAGTTIWPQFSSREEVLSRDLYLTGFTGALSLDYTYDTRGNLDSITYPSGQIIRIPRNDANAISQITREFTGTPNATLLSSINYNAAVLPNSLAYGNGVTLSISSDTRNRPDVMSATSKLFLDYRYNSRGLIDQIRTSQNNSSTVNRNVVYDSRARIDTFSSDTGTLNYNFDNFGNLTSKSGPLTASYSYSSNRISGVSYSASGNQLSFAGKTLSYNDDNRLKQVTATGINVTYAYDGKGNRIKSADAITGITRFFVYDEAGTLLSELSQHGSTSPAYIDKEYVLGPTGTLVSVNFDEVPRAIAATNITNKVRLSWKPLYGCRITGVNVYRATVSGGPYTKIASNCCLSTSLYDDLNVVNNTRYFYRVKPVYSGGTEGQQSVQIGHTFSTTNANTDGPLNSYASAPFYYNLNDHLGTARIITNQSGVVTGSFEQYPFGEAKSATGCRESSQQFTGKLRDNESGLQYFGARYLSNDLTRFTSVDPAASWDASNPQSWNRYAYSLNDPVNLIDPDGLSEKSFSQVLKQAVGIALMSAGPYKGPFLQGNASNPVAKYLDEALATVTPGQQMALTLVGGGVKGGKAPVMKGQEGVERAIAAEVAEGNKIRGKEITLETSSGTTRPDLLVELPDGILEFVESKFGPKAGVNPNQAKNFPKVASEGAIPRGKNAAAAGLKPGEPIGPTKVRVRHEQ